jgi:hypothetical protein
LTITYTSSKPALLLSPSKSPSYNMLREKINISREPLTVDIMQNTNPTSAQLKYRDEELWKTWNFSSVRARHIGFLILDGCSPRAASTQADFDFDSYTREVREQGASAEYEIKMFEQNNWEMNLWKLWCLSNARLEQITTLLAMGLSPEAAARQVDLAFKAYSLAFDDPRRSPESEIASFERYSRSQKLNSM